MERNKKSIRFLCNLTDFDKKEFNCGSFHLHTLKFDVAAAMERVVARDRYALP